MANGTQYNTKQELLDAIQALVFENDDNLTESDNIQKAAKDIVESLWDNVFPIPNSNIAYVNGTYGDDATGVVGLETKKFKTINAANTATPAPDIIKIEAGGYNEIEVFQGSTIYIIDNNTTIICNGSINESGFAGYVYGYCAFIGTSPSTNLFQNLSTCYIEFKSIITSGTKALLTAIDGSTIKLVGKSLDIKNKSLCNLGYEGIFGYPVTGSDITIYSNNIFYNTTASSTSICPFTRPNLDFRFYNCILKALSTSSSVFGRYDAAATNIKCVINNSYLLASAATVSVETAGAYQYTYIDNNTYSNKALDANSQAFQGTVIVDADIVNLF